MSDIKIDLNNLDKSNWKSYRFDEIAKNISERVDPNNTDLEVYIGLEHIDSESLHISRSGTPDDVDGQKLKFYKGDIIFGRRRAYQRKAAIATTDGFCSAHALVLRANPEVIDPCLFPFFMHSDLFMNRAVDISVGSLSPTINWGTLKHQEFIIPPKNKQSELAELLWTMDRLAQLNIALRQRVLCAKESVIKFYFSKADSLKKIKELGKVVTGSTPSTTDDSLWGGGVPFVTPSDITDSPIIKSADRFLTEPGALKSRVVPKNSILTVCIGSTIGKVAICDVDCCTNQQINTLIPNKEYDSIYILYLLRYFKSKILGKTGATAVPIINKTEFESILLPIIPSNSIDLFVKDVNQYSLVIENLDMQISDSKILHKTLINQVF
jgi:type I restriction enzyme S subunit